MKKVSSYVWGLFIVVFGFLILFKALNIIDFNIFFKGWWTLFIIVPSIVDIIVNDHKITSFNFLLIGLLLLLDLNNIIENSIVIFISIMIIELGLIIIFGKSSKDIIKQKNSDSYIGIFGESNSSNNSQDFQGCDVVAVFGTVRLDLSEIKLKNDVKIDAVNAFGTIYLTVPKNVDVKVSGASIFSTIYNKKEKADSEYSIYIESIGIFGDIRIK